jgi:hypothetical protein
MENDEPTNPAEGDVPEAEVETDVQTEPQLDEYGNPIEDDPEPEEEEDELDIDGFKVKLPKSAAEKLNAERLMQADYTRKTQELAEQRKAFDAERQTVQQADAQELEARAQLVNINQQLDVYQRTNWQAWTQDDPYAAQMAFQQFQLLKDAHQQTMGFLNYKAQERQSKQQQAVHAERQAIAKLLEEGTPELKKEIPDWSPVKAAKLKGDMAQRFGIPREDLEEVADPKLFMVMNAAVQWMEHQAKTTKAQSIQKQQQVQPAAKATRSSAPPAGLDDRLSIDEWNKRREAQLRKRA